MATNVLPNNRNLLIDLANKMNAGLALLGVALDIEDITTADFTAKIAALTSTGNLFNIARTARVTATAQMNAADRAAADLIGNGISTLKPHLGNKWNSSWIPAGFTSNSIRVPATISARTNILGSFKTVFTTNPTWEVSGAGVTATAFGSAQTLSVGKAAAAKTAQTDARTKKDDRDEAETELRSLMRGLIDHLTMDLAADDPRWLQFGLNMPASTTAPNVPQNVVVTPTAGHNLMAGCDVTSGASSYRWRTRVAGSGNPFVLNLTTQDPMGLLTGFTAGQTIEVIVEAVNGDAASMPSDPVQATTT